MNRKFVLILACCAASFLAACNESVHWEYKCWDGERICSHDKIMVCKDGEMTVETTCSSGMLCDPTSLQCANVHQIACSPDGERKCAYNYVLLCKNGEWVVETSCSANQTCNAETFKCDDKNVPQVDCSPGERKCAFNYVLLCKDGEWVMETSCSANQTCNAETFECDDQNVPEKCTQESERKCDDNRVMICNDGTWNVEKTCSETETCNTETFECDGGNPPELCNVNGERKCEDNRVMVCEDTWIVEKSCDENEVCNEETFECDPKTVPEPCSEEGAKRCSEDASQIETCTDNGWEGENCTEGLSCVTTDDGPLCAECDNEETRCVVEDGVSMLSKCVNYTWAEAEACLETDAEKQVCDANPGKSCVNVLELLQCPEEGNVACQDVYGQEYAVICENGVVTQASGVCEEGLVCYVPEGGCTTPDICGNETVGAGEDCEEGMMGDATCATATNDEHASGQLACLECKYDLTNCLYCGDKIINNSEVCDGSVPEDATCTSVINDGKIYTGTLTCKDDCTFDLTNCKEEVVEDCTPENCTTTDPNATAACEENVCKITCNDGFTDVDGVCTSTSCTAEDTQCGEDTFYKCSDDGVLTPIPKPDDGKAYVCKDDEGWVEVACTEASHCTNIPEHATMACNNNSCEIDSCEGNWSIKADKSGCECTGDYVLNGEECAAKCTSADNKCEGDTYYKCEDSGIVTTIPKPADDKHYICNASEGGWIEVACTEDSHCTTAPDHATMACNAENTCEIDSCEGNWSIKADKSGCECTGDYVLNGDECAAKCTSADTKCDGDTYYQCDETGLISTKPKPTDGKNYICKVESGWVEVGCTDASHCTAVDHATMACNANVCEVASCEGNWSVTAGKDACECTGNFVLDGTECKAKCTSADTKCEGDTYYKCEESGLVTTHSKPTDGKHYICNASKGGWVEVACTEDSHCTAVDHATMACNANVCEV
ncbi:MAG: hypothetical protein IJM59_04705, partial [Proteobacteria bacterium]|nr:hypothetical protein [Pseudomonadota bacterium]